MTYKELQVFLTEAYKDIQFKDFLKMVLVNGLTMLPYSRMDKFLKHEWKLNAWEFVDPMKEYSAIKTKLELGLTDPITEIERLGGDYHQVLNRWKLWKEKKKELGIESFSDSEVIQVLSNDTDLTNDENIKDENTTEEG
jgi:capsid protein